jgi:hypothetical protein
VALLVVGALSIAQEARVQNSGSERRFVQPVGTIQAALQKLPGGTSGRLPVLDGFVVPGPHPLSSYQRPYYQCQVRVTAAPGGSLVQVTAKITAWFSGPEHSGYQALVSNGRVEADLLDRLQDAVEGASATQHAPAVKAGDHSTAPKAAAPQIDAPVPQLPDHPAMSASQNQEPANPQDSQLQQEAKSLEEILRNQSHPTNLIAVMQDGTPVLQGPATDAKVLFVASAEDEFEVLDETPGWVHVRISGLSRGWLRRSMVEMLGESQVGTGSAGAVPVTKTEKPAPSDPPLSALFSVSSEEVGSFPGDWTPLKGKNVKIVSLQQAPGTGRITSPQEKKQFAEALFKKESRDLPADAAALVLVFDAEDGGMLAAPRAALDQWNGGTLSDSAFWKQCYMDPPEILGAN